LHEEKPKWLPNIHGKHGQGKGWYGLRLSIVISSNGWDMFAIVLQIRKCRFLCTYATTYISVGVLNKPNSSVSNRS